MVNRPIDREGPLPEERSEIVRVRRYRGRRAFMIVGIGLLILLLVALAGLWIARRPIATEFMEREFERRGGLIGAGEDGGGGVRLAGLLEQPLDVLLHRPRGQV